MKERIKALADIAQVGADSLKSVDATQEQIQDKFLELLAEMIIAETIYITTPGLSQSQLEDVKVRVAAHFSVNSNNL